MKKQALSAILSLVCLAAISAQCAIVYSPGPASQSPPLYLPFGWNVDLDSNGVPDFSLWSDGAITTMDYPSSGGLWAYYIGAAGTNQMLIAGYDALLQPFGAQIGNNAPLAAIWGTPWFGAGLAAYWWSNGGRLVDGQLIQSGWEGPLADSGAGYLGVRFYTDDGAHYGWVRFKLPSSSSGQGGLLLGFAPAVVDWAYETRPQQPICAGDIGSAGESVQFTIQFLAAHPGWHEPAEIVGTGSLILTGNTLRGELSLAGQFSSARILDPKHPRAKKHCVSDFGLPLASTSAHTAFFHDATLTRSQINHLLHGAYSVTVDDGALEARILP